MAAAAQQQHGAAAAAPIPYPGRYVVVKQFAVDRSDAHPLPDTAPLHYYNPFYLRLDLKTHSTRLLHNSIQQTSVDATPEHHYAAVVPGLQADAPPSSSAASTPPSSSPPTPPSRVADRRSCSVASAKKTVAFADKVDVCGGCDDDDDDDSDDNCDGDDNGDGDGDGGGSVAALRTPTNVLQVHSQTGEVVGDVLIERKRGPPADVTVTAAAASSPAASTPSSVDEDATGSSASDRRRRHEMFCRRRQSPVYSCNDDGPPTSSSSSSVYESCEDLPVVVLGVERGRSATAVHGYAGCCSL